MVAEALTQNLAHSHPGSVFDSFGAAEQHCVIRKHVTALLRNRTESGRWDHVNHQRTAFTLCQVAGDLDVWRQLESGQVIRIFAGRPQLIDPLGIVAPQDDVAAVSAPGCGQRSAPAAGAKNSGAFNLHLFESVARSLASNGKCLSGDAGPRKLLGQSTHKETTTPSSCENTIAPAPRRGSSPPRRLMPARRIRSNKTEQPTPE